MSMILCHYGIPGMKWGVRKSKSTRKHSSNLSSSVIRRMGNTSVSSYKKPSISNREKARVTSELMTNMTRAQREQTVISKYIGDHLYTFIKRYEGVYDVIHKK